MEPLPTCWCGTFAFGKCRGCDKYCCEEHSSLAGERGLLCSECSALPVGNTSRETQEEKWNRRRSESRSRQNYPLRSPDQRAADALAARELVERFLMAMQNAGFPGTEEWEGLSGWVVGTVQEIATREDPDGAHIQPAGPGARRTLVLLTDGRFAAVEVRTAATGRWRRRGSEQVKLHVSASPLLMPMTGRPDAINPWLQLLKTLPALASQHGLSLS